MAQQIQLTNNPSQTFRTSLGGQNVRMTVWWQTIDQNWYANLAWLDRRLIVSGLRLVGRPMRGLRGEFEGELVLHGNGLPGREAWTTTHTLYYLTATEAAML